MIFMLRIDCHTHILPRHMPRWSERFGGGNFIHLEEGSSPTSARMMQGTRFFREVESNCWDATLRKSEYDALETQVQVVCTIPVMFNYDAPVDQSLQIAQFLNDHIAELVQADPRHYVGLASVHMQDTDASIRELTRCKEMGMRGVQIG